MGAAEPSERTTACLKTGGELAGQSTAMSSSWSSPWMAAPMATKLLEAEADFDTRQEP